MTELTLKNFGYAPGHYFIRCVDCPADLPLAEQPTGDKRAWRCEKHAQARLDERKRHLDANLLPFNINHAVLVKLNEDGIRILRERHEKLAAILPSAGEFKEPATDDHGYARFQLWDLMSTFGPHVCLGKKSPFDNEILIPKDPN